MYVCVCMCVSWTVPIYGTYISEMYLMYVCNHLKWLQIFVNFSLYKE